MRLFNFWDLWLLKFWWAEMIPAHNSYGPKLKCYGLKFLFAKINLDSITFSKISPFLMAHE
jgi:hypothetical protein